MPYEDKQILRGSDGRMYQYDAGGNNWNLHGNPETKLEKTDPMASNAGVVGATANDVAKGGFHGLTDVAAGVGGMAGDIGNPVYNWATGTDKSPLIESADIKDRLNRWTGVPEPQYGAGHAARTATSMLPMMALPEAGVGSGVVRSVPGMLARRFASNVAAPTAGSEVAGAYTDDNPTARFVGALLGGRAARPWGGGNRIATQRAIEDMGAKGGSYLDAEGNKTVLPARERVFGKIFDNLQTRYGVTSPEELAETHRAGKMSSADAAQYLKTKRDFAVVNALMKESATGKTGQFTPTQVRDAVTNTADPLHNDASKLASTGGASRGALIGGVLGAALEPASAFAGYPFPGLSSVGGSLGTAGGTWLGARYPHLIPHLKPETMQNAFGNDPRRSAAGAMLYSAGPRVDAGQGNQ